MHIIVLYLHVIWWFNKVGCPEIMSCYVKESFPAVIDDRVRSWSLRQRLEKPCWKDSDWLYHGGWNPGSVEASNPFGTIDKRGVAAGRRRWLLYKGS